MFHVFSDLEGLRIAIEMERRGESFYRRAARVSKSEETIAMLNSLANDELHHRAEFERLYKAELEGGMSDKAYDDETNAYLTAIAAEVVFPKGLMVLKEVGFENAEAVLHHAIQSEKDSILFYGELSSRTPDEHAKEVFAEIMRQEKGHMFRLQRNLELITK
ncbi:MAG: ferritin family protein [Clostridia bacterium]|nr:ferritin family protein [Clostridia bacterium]